MSFWEQMGKLLVAALCFFTLVQTFCGARITAEERKEIVHVHNRLRGSVKPSASNMEKMVSPPKMTMYHMHGRYRTCSRCIYRSSLRDMGPRHNVRLIIIRYRTWLSRVVKLLNSLWNTHTGLE